MVEQDLFNMALEAADFAYAPYSKFKVGAAVLTENMKVFTGVNVENASYGASICAERTAMVKAVSEGHRKFKAIAIVAKKDGEIYRVSPCGICRQFILEFGNDIDIILGKDRDDLEKYKYPSLFLRDLDYEVRNRAVRMEY